jgi:hypothetical protein
MVGLSQYIKQGNNGLTRLVPEYAAAKAKFYIYLLEISIKHNNYCFGLNQPSSGPQELN